MRLKELIEGLVSLMADRKSFFREDGGDEMFRYDYEVLERTVRLLRRLLNQKRTVVKCHRKK